MKTDTAQYFTLVSIVAFCIIATPMSAFATDQIAEFDLNATNTQGDVDHNALAHFYENQAKVMQTKIDEQVEALSHKPRSSYFGKHGQDIKKHVKYKIDQFEKAADQNLQKAAYHKKMAEEQPNRPAFAKSGRTKG
ncbi:MAG: hypothetical protein H6936_00915 [Burkholderiales bacterium]|nr:hypothetical protein [Nitrosomonas sp.]MCP5273417.1 hypothetical protein [Burkholderiales bacterium]